MLTEVFHIWPEINSLRYKIFRGITFNFLKCQTEAKGGRIRIRNSQLRLGSEMKKLARNWNNSQQNKLSLPTRDDPAFDDSRPMDTQEQEELVRSFERSQAQQSRLWRTVFAALLCGYVLFLLYSIFQQTSSPWELKYHAYFMEEVYPWMIISADWVAVLACSFAIMGMLHESMHHRRWIWCSWFTGLVLAIFWLYYMFRLPRFRLDVIWLPFGPLGGASICLYVDHLLTESSEEVKRLRGYMYAYKAS